MFGFWVEGCARGEGKRGGRAEGDKCCMAAVTARQFAIRNNSDVDTSGRDSVSRRGWGLGCGTGTWQLDRDPSVKLVTGEDSVAA